MQVCKGHAVPGILEDEQQASSHWESNQQAAFLNGLENQKTSQNKTIL